jgi:hypothetical protein
MANKINVNGTWYDAVPKVKVTGDWKDVSQKWTKVSGDWKPLLAVAVNTQQLNDIVLVNRPTGALIGDYHDADTSALSKTMTVPSFFPGGQNDGNVLMHGTRRLNADESLAFMTAYDAKIGSATGVRAFRININSDSVVSSSTQYTFANNDSNGQAIPYPTAITLSNGNVYVGAYLGFIFDPSNLGSVTAITDTNTGDDWVIGGTGLRLLVHQPNSNQIRLITYGGTQVGLANTASGTLIYAAVDYSRDILYTVTYNGGTVILERWVSTSLAPIFANFYTGFTANCTVPGQDLIQTWTGVVFRQQCLDYIPIGPFGNEYLIISKDDPTQFYRGTLAGTNTNSKIHSATEVYFITGGQQEANAGSRELWRIDSNSGVPVINLANDITINTLLDPEVYTLSGYPTESADVIASGD